MHHPWSRRHVLRLLSLTGAMWLRPAMSRSQRQDAMQQYALEVFEGFYWSNGGRRCTHVRQTSGSIGTMLRAAILFLASDDASYITGSELVIDGGALAQ